MYIYVIYEVNAEYLLAEVNAEYHDEVIYEGSSIDMEDDTMDLLDENETFNSNMDQNKKALSISINSFENKENHNQEAIANNVSGISLSLPLSKVTLLLLFLECI